MEDVTTHTKTLTTREVAAILKKHFKLPDKASVSFRVESEYDPLDWQGAYGPDYVCKKVVMTWTD